MLNVISHQEKCKLSPQCDYHLTLVKMARISRSTSVSKYIEKRTLLHCWWDCRLVQPLWTTVWRFFRKLNIELPYDSAIPLLGIYLKKSKTLIQKDICNPMFTAALITIGKIWKQPKCPSIDEWIKKSGAYI